MADFRHPNCPLIRGCLSRDQLIFEVNFDHFAHQAIRRTAHGGNLLQNGQTGFAGLKRTLEGIDLAPDAAYASKDTFFVSR
jgi:hypothetical protein